jgi:small-conductance mechanosensitive channel
VSDLFANLDERTFNIIVVLLVAIFFWILVQVLTKSLVDAVTSGSPRGKRFRTLSSIVRNTFSTLIIAFVIVEILGQLGVSLAPLIASAGVAGLALGFGAQTLVKDVITGFFLMAEDQFDEGDEIEVQGKKGVVERITLRTITLRDSKDAVHIIPNGAINLVSNFSKTKKKR